MRSLTGDESWIFLTRPTRRVLVSLGVILGLLGGDGFRLAHADVLRLQTGEVLSGRIVRENTANIVIESKALGKLKVPRSQIDSWEREATNASPAAAKSAPINTNAPAPISATAATPAIASKELLAAPGPRTDGFDWIMLNSGEWLKGRLKAMQDKKLEFDSEELDLQTFDWEDVYEVRTAGDAQISFNDRSAANGRLMANRDEVILQGDQTNAYPRSLVLGITPGGKRELDYWSAKLSAGLTFRSGNTEETEFNLNGALQRRTPSTRFRLDYLGYYSETMGESTANSRRASSSFDWWLSQRFFLRTPSLEYFHDPFQNIRHRLTGGVGLGYEIIDTKRVEWDVVVGPAYQHTWFESVQAGEDTARGAAALIFGSKAEIELSKRVDLDLEYRGQYTSPEIGETTHHGKATLEIELTKIFDIDFGFIWDRISQPKANADGTVPKPNDYRLIVSLGLDY